MKSLYFCKEMMGGETRCDKRQVESILMHVAILLNE